MNRYEHEEVISIWLKAYAIEKEREFIKCIDKFIPSDQATLLDVGCGIGLHTYLWSERNKQVTASDFSTKFRDYILHAYHFPFIWNDVLNSTITQKYDICFCMAISTILHDEGQRYQTFDTLAKLVRGGSFLVLITGSNQWLFGGRSDKVVLHSINDRDLVKLRELGFAIEKVLYWSNSPKFLWLSPALRGLGRMFEGIGSCLGFGARKVVICRKAQDELAK
jgi:SAM-dependent methyltransferase